jgi:hypothetical protein
MDRGIPTEETLEQMRAEGACYLVGTPRGRLGKLEAQLFAQPWKSAQSRRFWVCGGSFHCADTRIECRRILATTGPGCTVPPCAPLRERCSRLRLQSFPAVRAVAREGSPPCR